MAAYAASVGLLSCGVHAYTRAVRVCHRLVHGSAPQLVNTRGQVIYHVTCFAPKHFQLLCAGIDQ
jgi:hypothetical protein